MTPQREPRSRTATCTSCYHSRAWHRHGADRCDPPPDSGVGRCGCERFVAEPEPSAFASHSSSYGNRPGVRFPYEALEPIPPTCEKCGHPHDDPKGACGPGCDCDLTADLIAGEVEVFTPDTLRQAAAESTPQLIGHLVSSEGVSVLSGEAKAGKSLIALDAALSYAAGLPDWHGHPLNHAERDGRPARAVVYCDRENSRPQRAKRMAAWFAAHPEVDQDATLARVVWHTHASFGLGGANDGMPLADRVLAIERDVNYNRLPPGADAIDVGLLVVDNLQRYFAGDDANSQIATRQVFDQLERLQADLVPGVLLVAHPSQGGVMVIRDALRDARLAPLEYAVAGHTAASNSADQIAVMVKDPDAAADTSLLQVVAGRSIDTSSSTWELHRSGVRIPVVGADGEDLYAPVFAPGPWQLRERTAAAAAASDAADERRAEFVAWLADAGGAWATVAIADEAGFPPSTVRRWLRDAAWVGDAGLTVEKAGRELRFRLSEEATA